MKVKRFNDEELSRILSHAGELKRNGSTREPYQECPHVGCINQAAYNEGGKCKALGKNECVAMAFDETTGIFTPDSVLRFLEKLGAA